VKEESEPPKDPIGVLFADVITTFFILPSNYFCKLIVKIKEIISKIQKLNELKMILLFTQND
ncbi:MAG: hypothetical protein MUE91_06380, partial [Ignavibacteriaceae bacterium]|nr:hypothetical protein [Ignavibacteriaceae bacterium]